MRGYRSEGLPDAVANAERVLVAAGIEPDIEFAALTLEPDVERALAFSLREAVTNVVRHAQARHCWITLTVPAGAPCSKCAMTGAAASARKAAACPACASACDRSPGRSSAAAIAARAFSCPLRGRDRSLRRD